MRHIQIGGMIAAMVVAQAAGAAGNTPITTPAVQARSVFYAVTMPQTMSSMVSNFDFLVRPIIETGFRQLSQGTTVQALLATPRGVVVACPQGGTVTARMSRGVPRVLQFEWDCCQVADTIGPITFNGPAEVTLLEASLAPKTIYSIRMGNASRDMVRSRPRRPGATFGETDEHFNLRMTGVMPQRASDLDNAPDFAIEVTGFHDRKQMRPDFSGGVPSVELYQFSNVSLADHALISRQRTSSYDEAGVFHYHEIVTFAWGTLGNRTDNPQRPTLPALSRTDEYRGLGIQARYLNDGPINAQELDGKVQVTRGELIGFGCTAPETFTFRTRVPLLLPEELPIGGVYRQGEISVNGSTTMLFTLTQSSSANPFDNVSRADLTSSVLPPVSYVVDARGNPALRAAARCTP